MANIGTFPPDPSAPAGALRLSIGDTSFEELPGAQVPPVEPRDVDYGNFSDASLSQLMTDSAGGVIRAKAFALAELAAIAAAHSVTIKTNDLGYSKERTATELRELAKFWSLEADKADEAAQEDSFESVAFPGYVTSSNAIPHLL